MIKTPRRRRLVIGAGGLLAAVAALYLAGHFMTSDKTPSHASVAGVDIGGMSTDQAITTLRSSLATSKTPITLSAAGKSVTLDPAVAGLSIDYAATVAQAGAGSSWNVAHIFTVLTGGGQTHPVVVSDHAKLTAAVKAVAPGFTQTAKDATVGWQGTTPKVTDAVPGTSLDVAQTAQAVVSAWPSSSTVAAVVTTTDPGVTTAEAQSAADQAKIAVASPITLTIGDKSVAVAPDQIAAATAFTAAGGTLSASTDMNVLYESTKAAIDALGLQHGRDATITIVNDKPVITPSIDGQGVSRADFATAVTSVIAATTSARGVVVPLSGAPAKFSTKDAEALKITEVTGEFTTYFPHADYRNTNLSLVAQGINNHLVKPDEIFSMNEVLGERTAAKGYVNGWVIEGNVLVQAMAGGISQSATTIYNAAFFAGLQDVEHHPHSMYFSRYPAGRESTIVYGSLDLRFKNDTPYGVLVQAYVHRSTPGTQGSITVRIWSTKVYDSVKSSDLVKSNYTTGRTITSSGAGCHAQSASPGFDVHYSRLFYKDGTLVKTERYFWRYSPTDEVVCTGG